MARTYSCALPVLQPALDTRNHISGDAFLHLAGIDQRETLRVLLRAAAEHGAHTLEEIILFALDAVRPQVAAIGARTAHGHIHVQQQGQAGQQADRATFQIGVVELAQKWCGDDNAALRLRFAADLALAQASTDALTTPERLHKLAAWFDAANRTRDLLRTTVRADLAVVELLLAWNKVNERPAARGNR